MGPALGNVVADLAAELGQEPPLASEELGAAPRAEPGDDARGRQGLQPAQGRDPERRIAAGQRRRAGRGRPAGRRRARPGPAGGRPRRPGPRHDRAAGSRPGPWRADRRAVGQGTQGAGSRPSGAASSRARMPGEVKTRVIPCSEQGPEDRHVSVLDMRQARASGRACRWSRRRGPGIRASGFPRGRSISRVSSPSATQPQLAER